MGRSMAGGKRQEESQNFPCEDRLTPPLAALKSKALQTAHSPLPGSHKVCLSVPQRLMVMLIIVLEGKWTYRGQDHLFSTGLGKAGGDHDPYRHRSLPTVKLRLSQGIAF